MRAEARTAPSALSLAPSWLLGTLLALALPRTPGLAWLVPLALAGVVFLGSARSHVACAGIAGFMLAVGTIHAHRERLLLPQLEGSDVAVRGWIDDFPVSRQGRTTFSLRVSDVGEERLPRRLRLTWYDAPAALAPGDGVCLTAKLRRPRGLVNPGGFDYERWAFVEGYGASGYVRRGTSCEIRSGLARAWLRVRGQLAMRIEHAFRERDAAALLTALVLGERAGFSAERWRSLQRTGTGHLFAISGLHVGLVAALTWLLTRWVWLRLPMLLASYALEAGVVASLGCAAVYAALAGFTLPTQRALIMLCVGGYTLLARRRIAPGCALASALLAVLLWDPLAPLSASFWLSFLAVALLLLLGTALHAPVKAAKHGRWERVRTFVHVQWGLSLGLLAPVALLFGQVSLAAPFVNLVAIPVFSLFWVPLAFLFAAVLSVHELAPGPFTDGVGAVAAWTWGVLDAAATPHWAAHALPAPALWAAVLGSLGALLLVARAPWIPGRALGWLLLAAVLEGYRGQPAAGELEATVLDVGHGLAVVIRTERHVLLYDTGPRYRSGGDAGAGVVVPALRALGVGWLDRIVVSHADSDHSGGLSSVLEAYPRARLLRGRDLETSGGVPCARGQHWSWDDVNFEILHPALGFGGLGNDGSCVLRVVAGSDVLLLTGDLESRGEARLVALEPTLSASVVVVPHHGSRTSSTDALVAATRPEAAVVSAGFANRWGFPRPEVTHRWQTAGARVVVTGEAGAISFALGSGKPLHIVEARRARRFWRTAPVPGESRDGEL